MTTTAGLLTGCATADNPTTTEPPTSGSTNMSQSTDGDPMTAESANAEQIALLSALTGAVPGSWGEATVNRFRTCTTPSGESGVQITREVRGDGVPDPAAAAEAFRSVLLERGFDAEVRRGSEVVGTGDAHRYAAFNADGTASIIQAYSACYAFDSTSGAPTVPPTPAK
ncbi:hypothetical protein FHW23_002071 [Curtobacterium pusillum]|uniref:Uncharacterized protein n=1 Tax=Curtobacterium pusillum TaxID=69373 RepID=A0AAW3T6A0_9MICO|nr:hypothetical protein [Curtobacterium pusillum]MBA8990806.1 hypothetical protein [Curtobacterium pusillum]